MRERAFDVVPTPAKMNDLCSHRINRSSRLDTDSESCVPHLGKDLLVG